MDIYILRDGKETGPFSEETIQSLLKQGSVLINDLAWSPGMPTWNPLVQVLYPAATPSSALKPPPPPPGFGGALTTAAALPQAKPEGEPATPKQKAFLSYIGATFSPDLTKEQAAVLVNEAMENSTLQPRVARWNEDRLTLHPELFAAEIQAKKDNRANRFFDVCQTEGADHFTKVTKAHCQVLVGYLDVRFPNWDAKESEAARDYFFPAVADKFPQLVKKHWRGKLKYPEGRKVAPELVQAWAGPNARARGFPIGALIRGIVLGLCILLVIYITQQLLMKEDATSPMAGRASTEPAAGTNPARNTTTQPAGSESSPTGTTPSNSTTPNSPSSSDDPGAPMNRPKTENPGTPTPANNNRLFESAPGTNSAAVPASADVATSPPKTFLVLTKATEVQLPFGSAKLPAGTQLKIVSQEGAVVKAIYANHVVILQASSTDLSPAAPSVPPQ